MYTGERVYHIYNRANGDENLFREEKNYEFFLEKFFKHIDPIAETYAYCLMPNHFHFMVRIRNEEEIVTNCQNLGGLTSKFVSQRLVIFSTAIRRLIIKLTIVQEAYFSQI